MCLPPHGWALEQEVLQVWSLEPVPSPEWIFPCTHLRIRAQPRERKGQSPVSAPDRVTPNEDKPRWPNPGKKGPELSFPEKRWLEKHELTIFRERQYTLGGFAIFRSFDMGLGKFPKISPERIQVRFSTGYVEVITGKFEPLLNHVPRNSLIINEFNILHREVKSAYKQFTSITKPLYLFDNQLKTAKSFVG